MRLSAYSAISLFAALSGSVVACSSAELSRVDHGGSATVADDGGDASPSAQPPTVFPDCGIAPPPPPSPAACTIPSDLVTYATPADLEPVIIGKWVRMCGDPEVTGEIDGVEFAADHTFWPLRRDAAGKLQRVAVPGPDGGASRVESWTAFVGAGGDLRIGDRWDGDPSSPPYPYVYSAPRFTPDGKTMALTYAPWEDVYERAAE